MEWLEQTRRINKSVDIICMETIDGIIRVLPSLRKKTIYDNKEFFDRFCTHYHKPNPVFLIRRIHKEKKSACFKCKNGKKSLKVINDYVQGSIDRCWQGINMVQIQWFEVIDLFWERPELVNPGMIDDYIRGRVAEVCSNHKKQNPLANGMWNHFGKHWKDENGVWKEERRKAHR